MSKELMYILITKMHFKLNSLIVSNNYDLLNPKVQIYSRRLDKVLIRYNRLLETGHKYDCKLCPYKAGINCMSEEEPELTSPIGYKNA